MIAEYALVTPEGAILEYRWLEADDVPAPGTIAVHKPEFRHVERQDPPSYNPATKVLVGPTEDVQADKVVIGYSLRNKTADEIAVMKAEKAAAISAAFQARAYAPIAHEVGGETYTFDADKDALENISGVVTLINAGVPVADPRPWTPRGSLTPVDIAHAELIGLGAAIAGRKDALYVVKKTLEAQLASLTTASAVAAFDPESGWGA